MLIKLHGTSGSGKSTIARALMDRAMLTVLDRAYKVDRVDIVRPIYIIGTYNSQCGGCDTLTATEQIEQIHKYAPLGHVFYEGLLGSEYYGKLGQASERYGKEHVFAFLDTPIEVCIERVKARRLAKGNTKPLNEENTRNRIGKIEKLKSKLLMQDRYVVIIDHKDAVNQVTQLYKEWERAKPEFVK
jgi:adenylate kinase family enzyme